MKKLEELERKYTLKLNAAEAGFLTVFLWDNRDERSEKAMNYIMLQLVAIRREMGAKVGVTVEKLPNGMIKFTSKDGTTIIREPYGWERY